jgi:hypothetical protein
MVTEMEKRPIAYMDLETYRNYFLCKFLLEDTNTFLEYTLLPEKPLNIIAILGVLARYTIVTFNGNNYDCPILSLALTGASNQQLKDANDMIITRNMKPWDFRDAYKVELPSYADHIDIMEVIPGVRISLKKYMGIAHCPTVQDLPIDPSSDISMLDRVRLTTYCGNDLRGTQTLFKIAIEKEWIPLREHITETIGIDVRSKSDAQIAEAIMKARLGFKPAGRYVQSGYEFTYRMSSCVAFQTEQLQEVQRIVATSPFRVLDKDQETGEIDAVTGTKLKSGIKMHADIAKIRVKLGNSVYKFGAGGLHSQEHGVYYVTDEQHVICDIDVGSFYPRIKITQRLFPEQCGPQELVIYEGVYNERMEAKRAKRKKEANSKKIVLNGAFGKLGSKYSKVFYAPEHLMQITISGQLYLLMLIEAFELNGIEVVSANTDGIVTRCHRLKIPLRNQLIKDWEVRTQMEMEFTDYKGIYLRDVNNYFAITTDGEIKRKGVFTKAEVGSGPSGSKAPHREISLDAAIAYVADGTPLEHTVYRCTDIRKFITVRDVKGGGVRYLHTDTEREPFDPHVPENMEVLGKVVRWVYRRDYTGSINYKTNGNKVADSTGAWPVMTLPDRLPDWIDYEYYIAHAREILSTIGVQA